MRIGLDLRCLPNDGTVGAGIAHAARALCSELIKDESIRWIPYVPRDAVWRAETRYGIQDASRHALSRGMKQQPCDLLFVPSGAVSPHLPVRAVPWVHDLTIFGHPEWFPQGWLKRQLTTRLYLRGLKAAPLVLSVSEFTRQAIIRLADLPPEKVKVTGEGGDETLSSIKNEELRIKKTESAEYCRKRIGLPKPFVLCLGTVEPRKNIAMLIRAWSKTSGLDLVIAGKNGWKFEDVAHEIAGLQADKRPHLHRLTDISDDEKRNLLLAAQAVAVPSWEEGFGLVALEGLQAGTPVIASDRGASPEVVGQAGILLDPHDGAAWSQAIDRVAHPERPKVLNSVGLGAVVQAFRSSKKVDTVMSIEDHDSMRQRREQAGRFSWARAAHIVVEALKTAAKAD